MRRDAWLSRSCVGSIAVWSFALWSLGCGDARWSDPAAEASVPLPERPFAYSEDGTPGPWWREGASRADFDVDLQVCRTRSAAARRSAVQDPPDAAYRSFLACMDELAWTRGLPPRRAGRAAG